MLGTVERRTEDQSGAWTATAWYSAEGWYEEPQLSIVCGDNTGTDVPVPPDSVLAPLRRIAVAHRARLGRGCPRFDSR